MKKLILFLMLGLLVSGCIKQTFEYPYFARTSIKETVSSYFKKDEDEEVVPEEPLKSSSDKEEVLDLEWDYSVDVHHFILHYTHSDNQKQNLKTISELPVDFEIQSYNEQGIWVTIPESDPTGCLAGEGTDHMDFRRLIICSFNNGKLIQICDQNGRWNSNIGFSYKNATEVICIHVRHGELISRTILKKVVDI